MLIFDQFETVGKASIDFLVDLLINMPDRFHIVISLRAEEAAWEDTASRTLYQYATELIQRQGANILKIQGLSAEEIGDWIKHARGIDLPLIPDHQKDQRKFSGLSNAIK